MFGLSNPVTAGYKDGPRRRVAVASMDLKQWFSAADFTVWREAAVRAVGGEEGRLTRTVAPGVTVPVLSPEALDAEQVEARSGPWEVRQAVDGPGLKDAERQAAAEAANEYGSPWIRLDRASRLGVRPDRADADAHLALLTRDDLAGVLRRVDLEQCRVVVDAGVAGLAVLGSLLAIAHDRKLEFSRLRASVHLDVCGTLARDGEVPRGVDAAWEDLAACVRFVRQSAPEVRVGAWSDLPITRGGGDPALSLAFLACSALETWRAMAARDLAPGEFVPGFEVVVGVTGDVLVDVAKIRAARRLLARVFATVGSAGPSFVHAVQVETGWSARDVWTNLLRSTQAGFAAAVAGADALTLSPHDAPAGLPTAESRRLARNLHILLRDEAHLGRTRDPAAGSGTIEALTDALCRAAWARVVAWEAAGGLLPALSAGQVRASVDEEVARRRGRFARRAETLVGVHQHVGPDPAPTNPRFHAAEGERALRARWEAAQRLLDQRQEDPAVRFALDALRSGTPDRVEAATNAAIRGVTWVEIAGLQRTVPFVAPAVPEVRWAEPWEDLQARATTAAARVGLWCAGSSWRAREGFARSLFEAGGFLVTSTLECPSEVIVVVCASDEDLAASLPAWADEARRVGAKAVVVAGRWPGDPGPWREAGVSHVVHLGSDVLGTLRDLLGRWEAR
jgi:methylmalonyl-CoA mutase